MSELDRRLADIAARQRMLFTTDQCREAGGDLHHIDSRRRGGRITTVDHNVHLLAGAPLDWKTHLLANVLSAGTGARASFFAAARLWDLDGFATARREVSVPRGRRYRRPDVRTHESTDLDRSDLRVRDSVPVTDPARTLLDLARYLGEKRLFRAIESARRNEIVDWSTLIRTLRRHARRGRPGIRRLRHVIAAHAHRGEITDSDFELLVIVLLLEHGLPEPVLHHRLYQDGRCIAEIDLAYPELRIAIELDSKHHDTPEAAAADAAKGNYLQLAGWTVLRFRFEQYRDTPDWLVRQVRTALRR